MLWGIRNNLNRVPPQTARVRARAVRPHAARERRRHHRPHDAHARPARASSRPRPVPKLVAVGEHDLWPRELHERFARDDRRALRRVPHGPQPMRDGAAPARARHARRSSSERASRRRRRARRVRRPRALAVGLGGVGASASSAGRPRSFDAPSARGARTAATPAIPRRACGTPCAAVAQISGKLSNGRAETPTTSARSCTTVMPGCSHHARSRSSCRSARSRCTTSRSSSHASRADRVVRAEDRRMPEQRADDGEVAADVEVAGDPAPRRGAAVEHARCRSPPSGGRRCDIRRSTSASQPGAGTESASRRASRSPDAASNPAAVAGQMPRIGSSTTRAPAAWRPRPWHPSSRCRRR